MTDVLMTTETTDSQLVHATLDGDVSAFGTLVERHWNMVVALALSNALQVFRILLQVGAGTGLLFLLRWFWWRINAFSEITAMVVSFVVAVGLEFFGPEGLPSWAKIVGGVAITTPTWLLVTFLSRPTNDATLRRFCRLVHPGGPGWRVVERRAAVDGEPLEQADRAWGVPREILCMTIGCTAVYAALIASGYWIYGNYVSATVLTVVAAGASALLIVTWGRVNAVSPDTAGGHDHPLEDTSSGEDDA